MGRLHSRKTSNKTYSIYYVLGRGTITHETEKSWTQVMGWWFSCLALTAKVRLLLFLIWSNTYYERETERACISRNCLYIREPISDSSSLAKKLETVSHLFVYFSLENKVRVLISDRLFLFLFLAVTWRGPHESTPKTLFYSARKTEKTLLFYSMIFNLGKKTNTHILLYNHLHGYKSN